MDARTESPAITAPAGPSPSTDPDEIRSILSNLSHEFCRPLVTLRMGFDLLLADSSRPISSDQRGHVNTMVVLCDDLLRLTTSYLDYAGLLEGTRPLSYGEFTASALIDDVHRQFARCAAERRINWVCGLDGPDASVTTDASRFQQITAHLVANALKNTPEGGEIRVTGRVDDRVWVVTVVDDGAGIPAEHVDRVFEPFYRLARGEAARSYGNGLGLAVCREMVAQLGGEIALHSSAGQGTRVTVQFPVEPPAPCAKHRRS